MGHEYDNDTDEKENHKLEGRYFQGFVHHGYPTRYQPQELH